MRRAVVLLLVFAGCWAEFPVDLLPGAGRDGAPSDLAAPDSIAADAAADGPTDGPAADRGADGGLAPDALSDGIADGLAGDAIGDATSADGAADTLAADTLAPDTLAADTLAPDTLAPDTLAADALAADTLAPDAGLGCDQLFQGTVAGYLLCQETATQCTFYFSVTGSANCGAICGTLGCVGAADNLTPGACDVLPGGQCGGKPCNCGAKMPDGICTCAK